MCNGGPCGWTNCGSNVVPLSTLWPHNMCTIQFIHGDPFLLVSPKSDPTVSRQLLHFCYDPFRYGTHYQLECNCCKWSNVC
ncbi:hypothetical protein LINPERPRIM_LOCUS2367 [Linum perenne]